MEISKTSKGINEAERQNFSKGIKKHPGKNFNSK